jgi:hypothetical protein
MAWSFFLMVGPAVSSVVGAFRRSVSGFSRSWPALSLLWKTYGYDKFCTLFADFQSTSSEGFEDIRP